MTKAEIRESMGWLVNSGMLDASEADAFAELAAAVALLVERDVITAHLGDHLINKMADRCADRWVRQATAPAQH